MVRQGRASQCNDMGRPVVATRPPGKGGDDVIRYELDFGIIRRNLCKFEYCKDSILKKMGLQRMDFDDSDDIKEVVFGYNWGID